MRFAGKGVIVPTSAGFTVPIEAVNLRAVTVEALQIAASNIPQFLQVNGLDGDQELQRVGRVVWRKTLSLDLTADKENRWLKVGLDVKPLVEASPGGLYRLTLSFRRPHVAWPCAGQPAPAESERQTASEDDEQDESSWDSWAENEAGNWEERYENRDNPCHPAYYQRFYDHDVRAARNVLVSDLGLMAKVGEDDRVLVFVNDLRTHRARLGRRRDARRLPAPAARDRAHRPRRDRAASPSPRPAFLASVRHGGQTGYLRMDGGSALPVAHFDVAGTRAPKGLKGFLYGERGIWRPGDTMHLTFVLLDTTKRLAADHPVRLDLMDPRGQLVRSLTRTQSVDGFYAFDVATAPDAPTGNYNARVSVGGASFDKTLKVETVMPNRLKIAMDFGTEELARQGPRRGHAQLGLAPRRARAKPEGRRRARAERFAHALPALRGVLLRRPDPALRHGAPEDLRGHARRDGPGEGRRAGRSRGRRPRQAARRPHDARLRAGWRLQHRPLQHSVLALRALRRRARSEGRQDARHAAHRPEAPRRHRSLDAAGQPAGDGEVELKLYKVEWRWWWEKGEENLAAWADASVHTPLQSGVVKVKNGAGAWELEIKHPDWGRYLITAEDKQGGHRAGRTLYVDWPGWAGRGQKEAGPGATVLAFTADKAEYAPGDTVTLRVPTPQKGRGLVSLESGSRVLRTEWIDARGQETRFTFTATPEMSPGVYAHVTLLQPHAQTANDLPIRLYGVAPVKVVNPQSRLQPVLEVPEVLAPEATSTISVREAAGRPMSYTVAIVDEGLLGLTRFETPNPWNHFYAREALAVRTWDVYDDVLGAYGAAMERMLAIGGDEAAVQAKGRRANRFPPMVRFLGPFRLAARATGTHKVEIPQYVGAVRVMVVAGRDAAFGAAEKSAFVRRPLMLLATLPRVLGPEESVALPVSVFALEPTVKDVVLSVTTTGPLEVAAEAKKLIAFSAVGDEVVEFRLRSKPGLGVASATVTATSGGEKASQKIELDVRSSTARVTDVHRRRRSSRARPGRLRSRCRASPGPTSRRSRSRACLRSTSAGASSTCWPTRTAASSRSSRRRSRSSISARSSSSRPRSRRARRRTSRPALERLRRFQATDGGFGYWPGDDDSADWATNYAGHFAVEAQKAGYLPPAGLLDQWTAFQRRRARAWAPGQAPADAPPAIADRRS